MTKKKSVGILIFNNAEVLDFCGPFEVFSVASEMHNYELFEVFTVAQTLRPIEAVNGLSVNPKYDFDTVPHIDILIISGGAGTRKLLENDDVLQWVRKMQEKAQLTLSIYSGARVLAKLGLLDEKPYATHHEVYDHLSELVPSGIPKKQVRYVQSSDKIFTSGGISAGIDLSFHIVEKLFGKEVVKKTADYMEYDLKI